VISITFLQLNRGVKEVIADNLIKYSSRRFRASTSGDRPDDVSEVTRRSFPYEDEIVIQVQNGQGFGS